jgi:hypothetical protein
MILVLDVGMKLGPRVKGVCLVPTFAHIGSFSALTSFKWTHIHVYILSPFRSIQTWFGGKCHNYIISRI